MRLAPLAFALLLTTTAANASTPISLSQAMADPDWIGPPVEDAWWRRDGKAAQYTLKRKGAKVSVSIDTEFSPESWEAYEAVYAQSWKPNEGSPAFLRRFAEAEGAAGRLRLGLARTADGQPVAAQLWTVESGTAFIHKLAHTEASKPVSPGTTLTAALFEQVIDRDRVSLVDFGTGDDPYKRDWMETVRPRYRIEAFRAFHPGNWPAITRNALRVLLRRG